MTESRHIRSFVIRAGRITPAQERALVELWPRYGIDFQGEPLALEELFGRAASRRLEIGFGNGEVIAALAKASPQIDHLGIEVHPPGVGRLLQQAAQLELANLKVIRQDAVDVLRDGISPQSLDEILIFFPDPWHKKRHHKRRLIDENFIALAARALKPGGVLRLATDWQDYAEQMLAVCNACAALQNSGADGTFAARPDLRPLTRFEKRGQRLGHGTWDLAYTRR